MKVHSPTVAIIGAGQSGLAAARAARDAGLRPLVIEAGDSTAGSWRQYYDSLRLFSPARYSGLPGAGFPGEPDRYPTRDEVVAYLASYAATLDVEIRTATRVGQVTRNGSGFVVHTRDTRTGADDVIEAAGVVAASGSFGNPYRPVLPGQDQFGGQVLHAADYRRPRPYTGQRVIIVGAGNSAVQIGYELARHAQVTLATRQPIRFIPQVRGGRDIHYWLRITGFDRLPPAWLAGVITRTPVLDTGVYRDALISRLLERKPMFTAFTPDGVRWADGSAEDADVVIFATGYRPHLDYLQSLGALGPTGLPRHAGGVSTTHPGLVYVGLEFQRSFASNTLRGVARDAAHVTAALAAQARAATDLVVP